MFNSKKITLLGFITTIVLLFQNCGSQTQTSQFTEKSMGNTCQEKDNSSCASSKNHCVFNGLELEAGESVKAYLNSVDAKGCKEEIRTCDNDGILSGSYQFSKCDLIGKKACIFNGSTLDDGEFVIAYRNSTINTQNCESEKRVCLDGALSGSYAYSKCSEVSEIKDCLFDGQTIPSGSSVGAYEQSTVNFGESCGKPKKRVCMDGLLSGRGQFSSCAVAEPKKCLLEGKTINHGQVIKAYLTSTVSFGEICKSENIECNNGTFVGGRARKSSCVVGEPKKCSVDGKELGHNEEGKFYFSRYAGANGICASEIRTCKNGTLSGKANYSSCEVPLRTMSWNLHYGMNSTFSNRAEDSSLDESIQFIKDRKIDVAFFQEFPHGRRPSSGLLVGERRDPIRFLKHKLPDYYTFESVTRDGNSFGDGKQLVIVSRYKILAKHIHELPTPLHNQTRKALVAYIQVGKRTVAVVNTHTYHERGVHNYQDLKSIIKMIKEKIPQNIPLMFGGDLNFDPDAKIKEGDPLDEKINEVAKYNMIKSIGLEDSYKKCLTSDTYRDKRFKNTFVSSYRRIDFLFFKNMSGCSSYWRSSSKASDHYAIFTTFYF